MFGPYLVLYMFIILFLISGHCLLYRSIILVSQCYLYSFAFTLHLGTSKSFIGITDLSDSCSHASIGTRTNRMHQDVLLNILMVWYTVILFFVLFSCSYCQLFLCCHYLTMTVNVQISILCKLWGPYLLWLMSRFFLMYLSFARILNLFIVSLLIGCLILQPGLPGMRKKLARIYQKIMRSGLTRFETLLAVTAFMSFPMDRSCDMFRGRTPLKGYSHTCISQVSA